MELTERGYHDLSMESVARRAGVGKAALYRRWADKRTMVVFVIGEITKILRPVVQPDGDDLASDLLSFAVSADQWHGDPRILADLIAAGLREPGLMEALQNAVDAALEPSRQLIRDRAERRGDPDPSRAMVDITAIVFWRRAVLRETLTPSELREIVRPFHRGPAVG